MSEDEDSDIQVPGSYRHSTIQESWAPLSYLAGLFPRRLSTFISLNLFSINLDSSHGNNFQGPINGYIANAENGGHVTAYSVQETSVRRAIPRPVPESTPNSRADCEIYYDQLLLHKRGCPLYLPGPLCDLPIAYRKTGCRIGDIGILYCDGYFDYFFNILHPADDPINKERVPEGFEHFDFARIGARRGEAAGQAFSAGSFLANSCTRKGDMTDDGALDSDLIFETESESAVLVLPGGLKFRNLLSSGCLKDYIATHASQWYSYIVEKCGRMGVSSGDVRLIIGYDKAHSWGIATRACSQEPGRFGFKRSTVSGSLSYTWYCPEGIGNGKSGPQEDEIQDLRQSTDEPPLENQTLFIRSMNFTLQGEISEYPDSVALLVRPSNSTTEGPGNSAFLPRNASLHPASSSNQPPSSFGGPQVGRQRGVHFLPAHFELPVVHPSTYLNQLLLEKFPNAKIAITNDWDWISVIREDDLTFPTSKDLCQRILESCQVSEENGIATILTTSASISDGPSPQGPVLAVDDPTGPILRNEEALNSLLGQCAFPVPADSVQCIPPPRCAPSTRQAITMKIEKWAKNASTDNMPEIFWLTGGAGAGKSTVARSVAEICKQENIFAAGFFSSTSSLTNDGASLIPTLVVQLLEVLPGLKPIVEDCIISDRDLFANKLDVQKVARNLFIEPLKVLRLAEPNHTWPPLIIIDGLDECQDPEFQRNILRTIVKAILEVPYPFRLLITSCSEDHLVNTFDHDAALQMITVHRWNLSDDPDADRDIYDFLEQQFDEIKCTHVFRAHLPTLWPGEAVLLTLVDMSSQHFICASMVVEYIRSPEHRPDERLKVVLGQSPPAAKWYPPFFQLDFLYSSMLRGLEKDHLQDLYKILGLRRVIEDSSRANVGFFRWQRGSQFLFCSSDSGYKTPLCIIETLLNARPGDLKLLLSPLRSLVSLDDCDIWILHKSLFDYLLDSSRSGVFHLNLITPHSIVTKYVVENWASFKPYPLAGPTEFTHQIQEDILAYHRRGSGLDIELKPALNISKDNFSDYEPPPAYHLIGPPKFESRISLPAYHSILHPSPASQQIHNSIKPDILPGFDPRIASFHPNLRGVHTSSDNLPILCQTGCDKQAWSVEYNPDVKPRVGMTFARAFAHNGNRVYSVRFSPDGHYLAVGLGPEYLCTGNGQVFIYDVRASKIFCILVRHQEATNDQEPNIAIRSVSFSPDGCYCVFGDSRGIIMVWKIRENRIRNSFVGHSGAVTSLDFSPNRRLLVSASLDGSIRIWNMRDGFTRVLIENANYFYSVKFSPDGEYIAAANIDKMLRIWHVRTGRLMDWWIGNTAAVDSIAFTPEGHGLVSGSWDRTVRHWNLGSLEWCSEPPADRQRELLTFVGHKDRVFSVAISPDGHWVLSGSRDGSTRIWDIHDGTQQCTLQGHEGAIRSVDFSPAGDYLAVGSHDGSVSLWKYERV